MFQFIANHSWEITLGAFWLFSAFVGGMPDPDSTSGKGYVWMYRSLHMLSGNLATAFAAKSPGQAQPSAQRGSARPGALVALALCGALLLNACSTSWVQQAEQILAVLVPAAGNVLALVAAFSGKSIPANDVQLIQKFSGEAQQDLQLTGTLIRQYQDAAAADKPDLLHKIDLGLQGARANLAQILSAGHIADAALQAKIQAIVNLAISELDSIEMLIPAVQGQPVHGQMMRPRSARQFKAAFNAQMASPSGDSQVDEVASRLVLK